MSKVSKMIKAEELDFYVKNKINVLFVGKHGVGKTAIVRQVFQDHYGDNCLYYSASSMDPWCDMVGIPKEKDGILELIRPAMFAKDQVKAIFMDEFNRAPKKVRNAVMELIQFKSINGHKFHNLEVVWAAINPDDDEDEKYDVEVLDPAQLDRFHAKIYIPYEPNLTYFIDKYGEIGRFACEWWDELPKEQQAKVSPRRLDYAMQVYNLQGNLRHILDESTHINKLINVLRSGPIVDRLKNLMESSDEAITEFFANENNFADAKKHIVKDKNMLEKFLVHMPNEKISSLVVSYQTVAKYFEEHIAQPKFTEIAKQIVKASGNLTLTKKLQKLVNAIGKFDLSNTSKRQRAYEVISYKISNHQLTERDDIVRAALILTEIIKRSNKVSVYNNINLLIMQLENIGQEYIDSNKELKTAWQTMKAKIKQ